MVFADGRLISPWLTGRPQAFTHQMTWFASRPASACPAVRACSQPRPPTKRRMPGGAAIQPRTNEEWVVDLGRELAQMSGRFVIMSIIGMTGCRLHAFDSDVQATLANGPEAG